MKKNTLHDLKSENYRKPPKSAKKNTRKKKMIQQFLDYQRFGSSKGRSSK